MKLIPIVAAKSASALLKKVGRGGSFPGEIALKLNPSLLNQLKVDGKVILVTGTNGKTSTSNLISSLLEEAGYRVVSNRKGDNMKVGIMTTLIDSSTLGGKLKADYIVLEVDELNVRHVLPYLPVDTLVITNFFRDQLDRAKEMEVLIRSIESVLDDYKGNLILNGNDPNTVRISLAAPEAKSMYFGLDKNEYSQPVSTEASEGKFCPRCGSPLNYHFYQYSHIGNFECPECGFKTPELDVSLQLKDLGSQRYQVKNADFEGPYEGMYSLYNYAALHTLAELYGISPDTIRSLYKKAPQPAGRNEAFFKGDQRIILNLVKNPTGTNEVLKVIERDPNPKTVLIVLNDREQDGTDVSWIYDAVFERLNTSKVEEVITTGTRKEDMALRLYYGGYENILTAPNLKEALQKASGNNLYVITTYTGLVNSRKIVQEYTQS